MAKKNVPNSRSSESALFRLKHRYRRGGVVYGVGAVVELTKQESESLSDYVVYEGAVKQAHSDEANHSADNTEGVS